VHLTHIGHPIVADKAYSGRDRLTIGDLLGGDPARRAAGTVPPLDPQTVLIDRQALHAHWLKFAHPLSGQPLSLTAPLPADMTRTLEALRKLDAVNL
jgi:23S rRNA pseudouridine1911/1915/1917 synthase